MSYLPKDWEIYAGIAFHAFLVRGGKQDIESDLEIKKRAIRVGLEMAEAVEKKNEDE